MSTKRFLRAAQPWINLGFNVVPARADDLKVPAVKFKANHPPDGERISQKQYDEWGKKFGDRNALVLWSSRPNGCIVAIDADKAERFEWVEETFGENPYFVETGRVGGGRHYLYRVPEPVRGRNRLVDGVDVKCWGGYTVAPGSIHAEIIDDDYPRHFVYEPSWLGPLPWDDVPEFPIEVYEKLRGAARTTSKVREKSVSLTVEPPEPVGDEILSKYPLTERLDLAKRILYSMSPAVEGEAGDTQTFRAALVGGDCGLSDGEFWPLLLAYNKKCVPPWDQTGLRGKLDSARRYRQRPFGCRLAQIDREVVSTEFLLGELSKIEDETSQESWRADYENLGEAELEDVPFGQTRRGCEHDEVVIDTRGMGAGKTQDVVSEAKDSTILAVTPLVSLCRDLASRLLAMLYQDVVVREGETPPSRLVTTLQGLHKQPYHEREHLLLDEIGMQLEFLLSQTKGKRLVNDAPGILASLFDYIAATSKVHLNEAKLDSRIIELVIREVQKRNPDKKFRIIGNDQKARPVFEVKNATAKALAWMHVRKKKKTDPTTWIGSSRTDLLIQFAGLVRKERKDLSVLVLIGGKQGTVNDPEIQELLRNPNELTKKYDVILASPVVASGVSITNEVDHVFFFHKYAQVHARTIVQSIARCRNVRSGRVILGVDRWKPKSVSLDSKEIEETICKRAEKDNRLYTLVRKSITGHLTLLDQTFLDLGVLIEKQRRENQADRLFVLKEHLERHGFSHSTNTLSAPDFLTKCAGQTECGTEKLLTQMKRGFTRGRKTHDRFVRKGVVNAKQISESRAYQLGHAYAKTKEQQWSIIKHELEDFYGCEAEEYAAREVTQELVEQDGYGVHTREGGLLRPGRLRSQARRFVDVETVGATGISSLHELCLDENTKDDGELRQPPERTSRARRARFLHRIVVATLGVSVGQNPNTWFSSGDVTGRLEDFLKESASDFDDFFAEVSKKEIQTWFEDQLRGMGCVVTKQDKGTSIHFDWGQIQEAAARERTRRRRKDEKKFLREIVQEMAS